MRFLVDANMPRSAAGAVQRLGHDAVDVRDVGLGGADDAQIAAYAKEHKFTLVTRDFDFSDVRNYPAVCTSGSWDCHVTASLGRTLSRRD